MWVFFEDLEQCFLNMFENEEDFRFFPEDLDQIDDVIMFELLQNSDFP